MMARKEEGGLSTPGVAQWTWRLIIERSDWYAYVCAVIKGTVWSPVQRQTYMPSLLAAIHGTLIPARTSREMRSAASYLGGVHAQQAAKVTSGRKDKSSNYA